MTQFGSPGTGAGQFQEVAGAAIDQNAGDVYLVDRNNQRVDKFTAEGMFLEAWGWGVADGTTHGLQTCTTTCFAGFEGSGVGEFSFPEGVAVDNDPLSSSYQDVYVIDQRNQRVEKFSPNGTFELMIGGGVDQGPNHPGNLCTAAYITGGDTCGVGRQGTANGEFEFSQRAEAAIAVDHTTGNLYVGDNSRVQEFEPGGVYVGQLMIASGGLTHALAVDAAGNLYVCSESFVGVREYAYTSGTVSSGTLLNTFDSNGLPTTVALDSAGHIFVDDEQPGNHKILEYDTSSGSEAASFDGGEEEGFRGIAWGNATERLYVVGRETVRLVVPPPPGPLVGRAETVSDIQPTSATVNATVNPEGHATTYRFEYGPTSSYGSSEPTLEGSLAASFNDEPVQATLTKLAAGTTYHYRVVATDSEGHVAYGADTIFTTLPAVLIDSEYVTHVASTSVTFGAQLNPLGEAATYAIEYGTSTVYGTSLPEASIGPGSADVTVSAHVQNLLSGIVYHYRVVARDEREGVKYTVDGPDQTFTTQSATAVFQLPDNRGWELVSSPDKHGAILQQINETGLIQAAADGEAMTYWALGASEAEPQGNPPETQILSTRSSDGWSSKDIAPPNNTEVKFIPGGGGEYRYFSPDLSLALVEPFGDFTTLTTCTAAGCMPETFPEATERTPYLRHDFTCDTTPRSCYEPLVTSAPGYADVPPDTKFGGNPELAQGAVIFRGATPDLSHVVLKPSTASKLTLASPPVENALYEWSATEPPEERLQIVSLLPASEGSTGTSSSGLGYRDIVTRNAISDDGSRIYFTAERSSGETGLYMRETVKGETLRIDLPEPGLTASGQAEARFQTASADGSKVFFTDSQRLTENASKAGEDLYVCEIIEKAGSLACDLTDLTPQVAGEAAEVQGALPGASEDGSYVYFVAHSVATNEPNATGETPVAKAPNLYVDHYDATSEEWEAPKLVAVLADADNPDWAGSSGGIFLGGDTSRVSPNGRWLAFMSQRSLTGYDNIDANSSQADEEVYLYHAPGGEGGVGKVVCASCDPSGARPVGIEYGSEPRLVGGDRVWSKNTWLAANVPGWTPFQSETAAYQSRYLSDSGRLFFNSSDALVPQDINGGEDVYEYESSGVGNCAEGSPTYSERSGGCVGLISSGTSGEESAFLDASESGNDVFFLTAAKLVAKDHDSALDVYDAHACTTAAPCISEPAKAPLPCTTTDSCREAPEPQPTLFGAPSSATLSAPGNLKPATTKPKNKPLTHAQQLKRALHHCNRKFKHNRHRRVMCKRRVRHKYRAHAKTSRHHHGRPSGRHRRM